MARTFAIGDIHGCCKTLKKLLFEELTITTADQIYCIGDYIDRGPDSKGVIDCIFNLRMNGYQVHTLRGNHEQMMLDAMADRSRLHHWLFNGGEETLMSFGIKTPGELPDRYAKFLNETPVIMETDQYIFVHAGLNFRIDDPFTDKASMLWTRDSFFDETKTGNRLLIHGHTPIPQKILVKQEKSGRINIDGGCVYDSRAGYGYLVALCLPEMTFVAVRNADNV